MLASGDAQQQAWVQSQAAAYNYAVTVDATGKASLQAAAQTQQAADTQIQAHQQVTQAATESAQAQSQAAKAAVENVENVGKAAEFSQHKMSDLGSKVHETLKKWARMPRLARLHGLTRCVACKICASTSIEPSNV